MPPLLLHIGYHKTATTWMQVHLFQPPHGFRQMLTHRDVHQLIVKPHGLRFDPAPVRALLAERLARLEPGEVPVISSEILSAHPFMGGHDSDIYAERLAAIVPQARILISIRNQLSILPSVYMQYLLRGGTMPYDLFYQGTDEPGYFGFVDTHFDYHLLVAHYQRLFGADSVYVLPQEALKADMAGAAAALADFAGATRFAGLAPAARKVHAPSYPEYLVPVLRRINHVQASTLNPTPILRLGATPNGLYRSLGYVLRRPPFSTLFQGKRPVSAHVRQTFAGRYGASNRALMATVTHPLDLPGYEIAEASPSAAGPASAPASDPAADPASGPGRTQPAS